MSKQDKTGSPLPPGVVKEGTMKVEITVLGVTLTLEGPLARVLIFLEKLFGTKDQQAVISRLQVMFGPEVKVDMK